MKRLLLLLICILHLSTLKTFATDSEVIRKKVQVGVTFSSLGSIDLIAPGKTMGGPGYTGNGFVTYGISGIYPLVRNLDFESGIEYSEYKIIIEPYLPLIYHGTPTVSRSSLINIPLTVRFSFLKYLFINGGCVIDMSTSGSGRVENQSGVGIVLGTGLKYDFKKGISLFVNPYTKIHSLISSEKSGQKLLESGFRFGLLFRID